MATPIAVDHVEPPALRPPGRGAIAAERDLIALHLHDTVVQRLFGAGLTLHSALGCVDADHEVADRIAQAIDELDRLVHEVRTVVFDLHTAVCGPSRAGVRPDQLERPGAVVGDELPQR